MNHTTERFKRTLSEAFPDVRATAGYHYKTEKSYSWLYGLLMVIAVLYAAFHMTMEGIGIIEIEMLLEEERAAVEKQQTTLAKQCASWKFEEIAPGVYQCFDDTDRKTKIVRVK